MGLGLKGGFLTLGSSFFQAFPSPLEGQWRFPEVVPDYSSGGCVRFSRTSLHLKPKNSIVKELRDCIFSPDWMFVKYCLIGDAIFI
jgi:hypothetical protein